MDELVAAVNVARGRLDAAAQAVNQAVGAYGDARVALIVAESVLAQARAAEADAPKAAVAEVPDTEFVERVTRRRKAKEA